MRIILLAITFLAAGIVNGQQLPQYSQYIFNGLVINPAYAGSKSLLNVNGSYRSQWMNIDGAPTTQTLSMDGAYRKNVGWGMQIINDHIGAQGRLSLLATYAYRIKITKNSRLAFGMSGGAERHSLNGNVLTTVDANDPAVPRLMESNWRPDARLGAFYHTERFYAGVSAMNVLGNIFGDHVIPIHRHYFLNTGYLFDINERVKIKPGIMMKEDFHAPTNVDLNAFVLFDERLWVGGTYRTGVRLFKPALQNDLVARDAGMIAAQYYINDNFRIGYSYDFDIAGLASFNTHELSLGYYFFRKQETPMVSPRYF